MFGAFLTDVSTNAFPILVAVVLLGAVWLIVLTVLIIKSRHAYTVLVGKESSGSIKDLLELHTKQVGEVHSEIVAFREELDLLQTDVSKHISKTYVHRFNPFGDTGGDQSFVVALLNNRGSGLVITSMHGRDKTRTYAKTIVEGRAEGYELSEEERYAIEHAQK